VNVKSAEARLLDNAKWHALLNCRAEYFHD
jgi:hypothetical protein